jgi:DNA-binding SARP family transcriptional activator
MSDMDRQNTAKGNHQVAASVYTAGQLLPGEQTLMVYTLGRFSLVREGSPIQGTRKAPGKPLQLLKALIAAGGRQVGAVNLAAILWPDQEGDHARRVFETTLHRLRKHLGDDRFLLLQDGHLTLNSAAVWVDVWEFERTVSDLRRAIRQQAVDGQQLHAIRYGTERILRLYQGHFLSRDDTACWSVTLQERLRNKFIHCMIELGRFWEAHALPDLAISCYQKGIEVDDLVECFYQRLMICYAHAGQLPEALAAYRQCRHILSVVLGLAPTRETQQIYQSIQTRYQQAV